jgi:ClpX C4-type zinc finger
MAATKGCFCGRTVDQVTHLVQGSDLHICVDACVDHAGDRGASWREGQIDYLLRLRNGGHKRWGVVHSDPPFLVAEMADTLQPSLPSDRALRGPVQKLMTGSRQNESQATGSEARDLPENYILVVTGN